MTQDIDLIKLTADSIPAASTKYQNHLRVVFLFVAVVWMRRRVLAALKTGCFYVA